jgi:hypothetical protein
LKKLLRKSSSVERQGGVVLIKGELEAERIEGRFKEID